MKKNQKGIISLGNDILGNDGIGWIIGDSVSQILKIKNYKTNSFGFNIIEILSELKEAIIIDSVVIKDCEIGNVRKFDVSEFDKYVHLCSIHSFNLPTAIKFLELYEQKPDQLFIYGINVPDELKFGEHLSAELEKQKEKIVNYIVNDYIRCNEMANLRIGELVN
ncbi:MAG TPA: hydrogenase maturation protease [bacterium]|nr:hydrogenase maturation protease [bacterium]HOL47746.1 hydrogenase maturation protease [bacterium]HPQ17698.1 hydrogenase maturation protease [bacterium]